jgi:phosphopantothenoylcysteine decarboxylase
MDGNRPHILLGVTGSVAAKLTPKLVAALRTLGEVMVVATESALYFWEIEDTGARLWTEEHEWPGLIYEDDQGVPHIALGDWADILVVAPLTANTLNKMTLGLADNLLTCTYYAWPLEKPIVLAPAMNTRMWQNPITRHNVLELRSRGWHHLVEPQAKRLACGTTGIGAMADISDIARVVASELNIKKIA